MNVRKLRKHVSALMAAALLAGSMPPELLIANEDTASEFSSQTTGSEEAFEESSFETSQTTEKSDEQSYIDLQSTEIPTENADPDMQENWQLLHADWNGQSVDLQFVYSAAHPSFAAIVPMNGEATIESDKTSIEENGTKLADLISEAGQFGLLFTEEGLSYLEAGNTITCAVRLRFDDSIEHPALWLGEMTVARDGAISQAAQNTEELTEEDMPYEIENESAIMQRQSAQSLSNAGLYTARILYGSMETKIGALKGMFPHHSYWNHPASDTSGNPESHTNSPSDGKNFIGNSFDYMGLCNGFAYLCYFKTNGVRVNNNGSTIHRTGNQGVKVGDVIHTRHMWDDPILGHYSYVWKIQGDTFYKLEGNFKGPDQIWHTNTVTRKDIVDYFTPATQGKYTVYFDTGAEGGSVPMQTLANTSGLSLPSVSQAPKYHRLQGWELFNMDNGAQLYTNGSGNYRWYNTAAEAKAGGCPSAVIVKAGQSLPALFAPGQTIIAQAKWERQPYTIAFDANGGSGTIAAVNGALGLAPTLPQASGFSRAGYVFTGFAGYHANGQRIYSKKSGKTTLFKGFASDAAAKAQGYAPHIFQPGNAGGNLTETPNERIVMKAQWRQKKYTVKWSSTGSNKMPDLGTFTYGATLEIPKWDMKQNNATFIGWSLIRNGHILCEKTENNKKTYRLYANLNQAANEGFSRTLLGNGSKITLNFGDPAGEVIELQARWSSTNVKRVAMHRLYNPNSGEHFYTAAANEKDVLVKKGWKYEGTGWLAPQTSKVPVYRLYNPNAGDHHYTLDANEQKALVKVGWKDEGIGWYSDEQQSVPIYRQYNPNAKAGSHNYSSSLNEHLSLSKIGWKGEGIGWYGMLK